MVHEGTETLFNEDFFTSLDFVTNALDNIKARNYMDSRCVFFEKPLFERCLTPPFHFSCRHLLRSALPPPSPEFS